MKRDTREKNSLFLSKKTAFFLGYLASSLAVRRTLLLYICNEIIKPKNHIQTLLTTAVALGLRQCAYRRGRRKLTTLYFATKMKPCSYLTYFF
jgi:hypothetical protein